MADSALGSALIIPKSALEAIKRADERIQSIQDHSRQMGQTVNSAFTSMTGGARIFVSELDKIITKLGTIDSKASKMSGSLSNLGAEKAAQQVSNMNNVVAQTVENIERMSAAQRKSSDAMDMSKSIADYQKLQEQINKTAERQEYLTKFLRSEQVESNRIGQGKGGIYHPIDVANAKEELAVNNQLIASLKEEQQAIVNANKALNEKVAMYRALRSYVSDSNSLDNQRSSNTLAEMRQYYKELEKSSAQAEKQRQKEANAWLKNKEKEAQAAEKAAQREQDASDKAAAKAEKDAERIRAAQEKAYMTDWLKQQQKAYYTNTSAVVGDANSAKTLREHLAAIKELKQARLDLDVTDKNYKQNLASVNEAIKQHSKVLKEAGVNAKTLGEQTSYMAGYMSRWAQRMAFAFSMGSIKSFVEQIAEVRGQFELSERSLEAILQNKPKADEIFNKTVELAVKSPFRIKDLVDYTRQLSAYRIESDKLYDTTKRLADVSAGLGVDMGRLILAYGQVKAAAYLRGSEVRQFTEAGINMYGELQQYFKEVKGEAYTTAQIVDMISKRKVTFEDVEAIFQRMTDKGGTFYNMQEIQAETLQGKISNLKDAFDVMLNDIGKANEGTFKGMISTATELLSRWEAIANTGKALAGVIAVIALYMKQMGSKKVGDLFSTIITSENKAITTTNLLKNTFAQAGVYISNFGKNLKAAFLSNLPLIAITAAISAVVSLISAFKDLREAQKQLGEEYYKNTSQLNEISDAYDNISNAAKRASKSESNKSSISVLEEKKKKLQDLLNLATSSGLTFDINIQVLKEDNIDKTFESVKTKYKDFVTQMAVIENNAAKNKAKKDHWFTFVDDFDEDAKDYSAAAAELISHANDIDDAIAAVAGHQEEATDRTRKYYQEVKAGKKAGESELDYYERMYNVLAKIGKYASIRGSGSAKIAARLREKTFFNLAGQVQIARDELNGELDELFKETSDRLARKYGKNSNTYRLLMSAEIDNRKLDSQVADLAKKRYKAIQIPSKVDKGNTDREIKTIIQDLQDTANKNKITLSVDVTDPKNLNDAIGHYQKSAKDWQETIDNIKRSDKKFFTGAYLDIGTKKKWGKHQYVDSQTVFRKSDALKYAEEQKKAALYWNTHLGGLNPFADKSGSRKNTTKDDKRETDIFSERISLLKEMNQQYEKLDKYLDDDTAAAQVMKQYADNIKFVGMPDDVMKGFVPDKQGLIKALKKIEPTITDFKKRAQLKNDIIELKVQLDTEYFQQQLDDVKNEISNAFDNLNLYKKLQGEGLSDEAIKNMFGNLTSSFSDVRNTINEQFAAKFGDKAKWSTDVAKQWQEQMDKLDKQVYQDQVNQAQELIKEYKTNLTERLQLYKWYYEELNKIQNNANISKDKEMQDQMIENLKSQFRKKSTDIDWKEFQNSDTYISIFENLDHTSTKALDYMIDRLYKMREQLKGLDPTQVKAITEQIEKLEETRDAKNPFKAFTTGLKEMIKANKEFKKLGGMKEWLSKNKQNDAEKEDIEASEDRVAQLEAEVKQSVILNGTEDERTKNLKLNLGFEKATLASKKAQNKETQDSVDGLNSAKDASDKAKNKFANSVSAITSVVSTMASSFNGLFEALGGSDAQLENAMSIVDNVGSAIGSYFSGNWAGVASGVMGVATGIAKLFSNESKIDKEIQRQEQSINSLQRSYNKLKQSMDDAFDTQRLYEYNQKSVEALKAEQKSYEAMIKAEQGRKNPDDSKIQQWRDEIEDLNDTIKELEESMTEQLGGFGSQSNYKSAAEAFAEAWVDAFNEGSDALDALNDKFDEYFDNLVTKQLMNRATTKYIQPILDAFDKAVSEGSDGGNNGLDLTEKEVAKLQELKKTNLAAFDEYAKSLMEVLNIKPTGSSNISALQQGIQSVTESTAQALESILNSCRWYIAQQQQDVRAIRAILEERLGNVVSQAISGGSSNQMIALMEQQTGYLHEICDNWSSVIKPGHKQGGKGIKVFMNSL